MPVGHEGSGQLGGGVGALLLGGKRLIHWASEHTGLPLVIVAALALVVSFRLAKRTVRLAVETALVALILLVATRFGWIRW